MPTATTTPTVIASIGQRVMVTNSGPENIILRHGDTPRIDLVYPGTPLDVLADDGSISAVTTSGTATYAVSVIADVPGPQNSHEWADHPSDYGLISFNYPPILIGTSGYALTPAGTVFVSKLRTVAAASIARVHVFVSAAGATLTAGQCFAALYDSTKTLLGTSADASPTGAAGWASTGFKTHVITGGPVAVNAGTIYVALFYNGTTGPTLARASSLGGVNAGLSAAASLFGTADTGRTTTMPAALGTMTATSNALWVGVS